MNEQTPTTTPAEIPATETIEQQRYKTIAVRVEEHLHSQLQFISQLSGTTITDEIRSAIEHRISNAQEDPDLLARAQKARQEIEREAAARSAAIVGFIGQSAAAASVVKPPQSTTRSRRPSKPASGQDQRP
ncbi:MAG: hypothetical protein NTX33_00120 [Propionibacteriales bacterium]|nr:hypothetical protein [Propionibacteriales bacterium]